VSRLASALVAAGRKAAASCRHRYAVAGVAARVGAASRRMPAPLRVGGPAVLIGVVVALPAGGVAGFAAGCYGGLALAAAGRHRQARHAAQHRGALLDLLGAAAADLRAGLPPATALAGLPPATAVAGLPPATAVAGLPPAAVLVGQPAADPAGRRPAADLLAARAGAALRLADRTGAPLADLLERIEVDARTADRTHAAAQAQAAGARATALLLAALPVGGIALGYSMGVDPLSVLRFTPLGAACAVGAIVLQLAGLVWSQRLARPGVAR
jgi:tight adherence protein B